MVKRRRKDGSTEEARIAFLKSEMNPLIILTSLALWSAVNSYRRQRAAEEEANFNNSLSGNVNIPATSSASSIHFPSSYISAQKQAQILSFSRDGAGSDSDATSFTTSNGISSSHKVFLVPDHEKKTGGNIAMSGHTYHTSPEGMQVSLTWSADDTANNNVPKFVTSGHGIQDSSKSDAEDHYRLATLKSSTLHGGFRTGRGSRHEDESVFQRQY